MNRLILVSLKAFLPKRIIKARFSSNRIRHQSEGRPAINALPVETEDAIVEWVLDHTRACPEKQRLICTTKEFNGKRVSFLLI